MAHTTDSILDRHSKAMTQIISETYDKAFRLGYISGGVSAGLNRPEAEKRFEEYTTALKKMTEDSNDNSNQ